MPRRQTHALMALSTSLLIWLVAGSKIVSVTFMVCSALFLFGNLAPDLIEPSYFWNHRGWYHSEKALKIAFLLSIVIGLVWVIAWLVFKSHLVALFFSFPAGYAAHLLVDSTTKMGLPKGSNK